MNKNLITSFYVIILLILFSPYISLADDHSEVTEFRNICKNDLDFIQTQLKKNSSPYANEMDSHFREWYKVGYQNTLELINNILDQDDCYYVIKYYINGFAQPNINIKGYYPLPSEQYPGILSAKKGDKHYIIYKNPQIKYLKNINVGDEITHINDKLIQDYHTDYLLPFYANDTSDITSISASIYALIVDGNGFKPFPKTITVLHNNLPITIELQYTNLDEDAVDWAKKIKQPNQNNKFKIELISNGIWITIPSFSPKQDEIMYYASMISRLKSDFSKEEYIVFDLRGNTGGPSKWSVPIIRNLWGDDYLKSLKDAHDYNKQWVKKIRISKENFEDFRKIYDEEASAAYLSGLKKNESFFLKKWSIYNETDNLYTYKDSRSFKAKIYVLTDNFCQSTCWSFVNELKQIPGVIHVGIPTAIQNVYSYAKKELAPSKNFDFFYPTEIRIKPATNLLNSLTPEYLYEGDLKDEPQVIDWVLSITEKEIN